MELKVKGDIAEETHKVNLFNLFLHFAILLTPQIG